VHSAYPGHSGYVSAARGSLRGYSFVLLRNPNRPDNAYKTDITFIRSEATLTVTPSRLWVFGVTMIVTLRVLGVKRIFVTPNYWRAKKNPAGLIADGVPRITCSVVPQAVLQAVAYGTHRMSGNRQLCPHVDRTA
jgi:hypothetical protein